MRGKPQAQPDFLTVINLNQCVPRDHPLRAIKQHVDAVLKKLSPLFDELYADGGRDSVPPEQLLKARILTALYSVRSERLFCEQLGYNLLWLWFLDREFNAGSFNHSVFAKNYQRVLSADVAKLSFGAHLLMENRNGLCAEFSRHNPITESEPAMALRQLDEHGQLHEGMRPKTIGADKNYHQKLFVQGCRQREIIPHVACKDGLKVAGLDGRTTGQKTYAVSQRIRKRVEEIIGWIKTVGGLRRSRYRGLERTQAWGYFVAGTYNLLRLAKLGAAA